MWRIKGSADLDTLREELGVPLPEDTPYDTLAGMVLSCLHTIPPDGSTPEVQVNGLHIRVERIQGRRIETALVQKAPPPADTGAVEKNAGKR